MSKKKSSQIQSVKTFRDAYRAYGRLKEYGWLKTIFSSPYFYGSILIFILTTPIWCGPEWWDKVFSILPSVLGFTVGVYGILVGASIGNLGKILSKPNIEQKEFDYDKLVLSSQMARLAGTFVHFLLIQFVAIILALVCEALYSVPAPGWCPDLGNPKFVKFVWMICGGVTVYALFLALATIEWLFAVSKIIIGFHQLEELKKENDEAEKKRKQVNRSN